jgi:hypothetical protein
LGVKERIAKEFAWGTYAHGTTRHIGARGRKGREENQLIQNLASIKMARSDL